jgi:hypothetical protein
MTDKVIAVVGTQTISRRQTELILALVVKVWDENQAAFSAVLAGLQRKDAPADEAPVVVSVMMPGPGDYLRSLKLVYYEQGVYRLCPDIAAIMRLIIQQILIDADVEEADSDDIVDIGAFTTWISLVLVGEMDVSLHVGSYPIADLILERLPCLPA